MLVCPLHSFVPGREGWIAQGSMCKRSVSGQFGADLSVFCCLWFLSIYLFSFSMRNCKYIAASCVFLEPWAKERRLDSFIYYCTCNLKL